MRYLGLDIGDKRIGIALSDESATIASPLTVYKRQKSLVMDIEYIKRLVVEKQASAIVVGVPYALSGRVTIQTQKVLSFVESLKKAVTIEVRLFDERFSTQAAERVLIDADMSRKKRKKVIDTVAAAYILQGFLDMMKNRE
ncbi:MAG: Holliday junction resolvase RuvX [Myxococcota bacterium]